MTQIAQIVSLSLNQAMGEFNMRLNGLQQQVVHQQNVFAQAQVHFFSVQRRMASARSFNMFQSMLHMRLIN